MKRIIFFLLAIMFSLAPYAQKTVHKKPVKKTAVANRKHQAQRKPAARRAKAPTKAERRAATYSNASIRGLQGQRADIQRRIREQEQALRKNKADVKKRLEDLMALNGEIDQSQKKIEGIEKDIHHINGNIGILQAQLKTLQQQLQDRKNKYIRSMRYMSRHHTVQDKLMFIFSAKNLTQMYRRLSFIRQYSSYQKVQGERSIPFTTSDTSVWLSNTTLTSPRRSVVIRIQWCTACSPSMHKEAEVPTRSITRNSVSIAPTWSRLHRMQNETVSNIRW